MNALVWQPIATVPRDGKPVYVRTATVPAQLMWWAKRKKRWETYVFTPMRRVLAWWDEKAEQPTEWAECVRD